MVKQKQKRKAAAPNPLIAALLKLKATGSEGFEGFVRDLLEALTGQRFRIMKSTHQGGVDVLQDGPANSFTLGIEGKKYGEDSPLPLDDLKKKIVDAADSHPGLDLWILATTREISATDQQALLRWGETWGIAVEIIDSPDSPSKLAPLAVLAAAALDVTQRFLGSDPALMAHLNEITKHVRFAATRDHLHERFTNPDVGYAAAQRRMAQRLRDSMRTLGSAKADLGGYANLLDGAVRRIGRPDIDATLDQWSSDGANQFAALLGGEGVGKTWAALSWWDRNAGDDGSALPLTLFIPARFIETNDAEELIARALEKRTGFRTVDFWKRRIRMWLSASGERATFLLLIDGLNERWEFNGWTSFLQPLNAGDWEGRFAVMLTCRPDHWHASLKGLVDLEPRALEVAVKPFDAKELDALLDAHGLTRAHFSPSVLKLMANPRLSSLAIGLQAVLEDAGDVTAERLVYEDWKQRLTRRGAAIISDQEFRELVTRLGTQIQQAIAKGHDAASPPQLTRSALFAELGRDSGGTKDDFTNTLSELIDGRWLVPVGDQPHRFTLEPSLTPYALAMALINELKTGAPGEAYERMTAFLDHSQGSDLATSILRAATTIIVMDAGSTEVLKRQVTNAWLTSQNFRQVDLDAFWRLIGLNPALFIELAEELWIAGGSSSAHRDEMLIKAIGRAGQKDHVARYLVQRASAWLGTFWLDPHIGAFLSYDDSTPDTAARRRATADQADEWKQNASPSWQGPPLTLSQTSNPEGTSWFIHRAIGILSLLPRKPFAAALVGWAVSRAIMGKARHYDEIAWLLRFNLHDPADAEQVLLAEISKLQALGHPLTIRAAQYLIEALATPKALALLSETQKARTPRIVHRPQLRALAEEAMNPDFSLRPDDGALLTNAEQFHAVGELWQFRSQTSTDLGFEPVEKVLARWNPARLGALIRETFATASDRSLEGLWRLSLESPNRLLFLNASQRAAFGTAQPSAPPPEANEESSIRGTRGYQTLALLYGVSAADQLRILDALPGSEGIPSEYDRLLASPRPEDFEALRRRLTPGEPVEQLRRVLIHVSRLPDRVPPDFEELLPLTCHTDELVRQLALDIILESESPLLQRLFLKGPWRYEPGMKEDEAVYGSLILCLSSREAGPSSIADIMQRCAPESLARLLVQNPNDDGVMNAYADYVRRSLEQLSSAAQQSLRRTYTPQDEALDLLIARFEPQVTGWIASLLNVQTPIWRGVLINDFPVIAVCRALLKRQSPVGAQLWRKLWSAQNEGGFTSDSLTSLAFGCPAGPDAKALRQTVIEHAADDEELLSIAREAEYSGQIESLTQHIENDLQGTSASAIARALTLAGLLDNSAHSERLWGGALQVAPAALWLAHVHASAAEKFQRNRWARTWFERFLAEADPDRAYGYYVLFAACADAQALVWAPRRMRKEIDRLSPSMIAHVRLGLYALRKKLKEKERKLRNTLFGEKVLRNRMDPWL